MMVTFIASAITAFWLGVLTSISPCPLATNIAAVSFVGKKASSIRSVLLSGLFYTFGRALTYLILGLVVINSLLSIPFVSNFLQNYMNKILGPILIVTGMFLLEMIRLNFSGQRTGIYAERLADSHGLLGAGLLGIIFALAFCPVSAALFFGSLITLSVKLNSRFTFPFLYGIGTGFPVLIFAVLLAMGSRFVGSLFNRITAVELWARRITGIIFISVGVYFSITYIFCVFL